MGTMATMSDVRARLLSLLSLLQTPRLWPGSECGSPPLPDRVVRPDEAVGGNESRSCGGGHGEERLLISVLGRLSAPETVRNEVLRKATQDPRFSAAVAVWRKLAPNWIEILSDDATPELAVIVNRITQQPMRERLKQAKDLGETMVIAHAVVAAERGSR